MKKSIQMLAIAGLLIAAAAGIIFTVRYGSGDLAANRRADSLFSGITGESGQTQIYLNTDHIEVEGTGASVSGTTVSIDTAGEYWISGNLSDGQIYVEAEGEDVVVLYLNGVDIFNKDSAAIYVENARETWLMLAEDTENRVQSGETAEIDMTGEGSSKNASGAAVYARDNLAIAGEGSLQVFGYLNNGIQTSNDLRIESGSIQVTAVNNGIKGKDSVTITGGEFHIVCGGDGIKSDDTTGAGYGVISISGGTFFIEAGSDAIQAETALDISGGIFTLQSGGGAVIQFSQEGNMGSVSNERGEVFPDDQEEPPELPDGKSPAEFGFPDGENPSEFPDGGDFGGEGGMTPGGRGGRGGQGFGDMTPPDGNFDRGNRENGMPQSDFGGFRGEDSNWDKEDENTISQKGLKSGTEITITGGTFAVDTADDGIHSNGTIRILDGLFSIASGDDGIHADTEFVLEGGNLTIEQSYEGVEANQIHILDGTLSIASTDDGINANGGQSGWGFRGPDAADTADNGPAELPELRIEGGTILVNAGGDGLDSNGNIIVEGGVTIVDGPSDNGNGALDYGSESGGKCIVNGGTILAVGSSGMAETFDETSKQCSFRYNMENSVPAGTELIISDADGNVLFNHTTAKTISSVVFSSPELAMGETYSLSIAGDVAEITQDTISTKIGRQSEMGWGWKKQKDT